MHRFRLLLAAILFLVPLSAISQATDWFVTRAGTPKGNVELISVKDSKYKKQRRLWIYTPPGYSASRSTAYPLLVVFDGESYVRDMPLPVVLDNLLASGNIPPIVAVMIDNGEGRDRQLDLANRAAFAAYLGNDLIPFIRSKWNVTTDPQRTVVMGYSAGGLAAAFVAFKRPDLFGEVISQSPAFWRGNEASNDPPYEWLVDQYKKSPKLPVSFYIEVGAKETASVLGGVGPAFIDSCRRMRSVLKSKGYEVSYKEIPGAMHNEEHWNGQIADAILYFANGWK